MKRPLCWIGLGCFAAAAAFCSFYPAKEWIFPATALFGLSGLFCLLSTRTRPAAIFSFSAAFMLLFCLLYGHLFAKPALDLSGRTLSSSGTVLETGRASFLLDGETESGQALNVQVWCSTDMVPNRYQEFSGIVELSAITSTDRFDSESYYRSRGIYLQGQCCPAASATPNGSHWRVFPAGLTILPVKSIRTLLPEKYSGLVCAVALATELISRMSSTICLSSWEFSISWRSAACIWRFSPECSRFFSAAFFGTNGLKSSFAWLSCCFICS